MQNSISNYHPWSGAREAESGSLLRSCAPKGYRGFESLLLRNKKTLRVFFILGVLCYPERIASQNSIIPKEGFETERCCVKRKAEALFKTSSCAGRAGQRAGGL